MAVALVAEVLAGCAPSTSATPPAHSAPGPAGSVSAAPTASLPPSSPLAGCGAPVVFSSLPVAGRLANADDVAAAPDGTIWVTDAASALLHIRTDGSVLQRIDDPRAPEGVVVRADGSLLVAEQRSDRVVMVEPATATFHTLVQLRLPSGQLGVDGIGYDGAADAVLVPDAPNGRLLETPVSQGATTELASGLGRPVGVAMVADGSFVVAAENATGLLRIPARGGTPSPIPGVSEADDVVVSGQLAYVTLLDRHELIAIDLATLQTRVLVTNDESPQGLAQLPDGRLALTNSTTATVALVPGCAG